ncbi:IclR family transcriptional regulator [Marinobacterium zhoushanense]|uniref:IclR family transcriptional regulator n=1 Tax=Marinobacterium zhoushanense TaxID=1679163 RepID=A0ABQ1K5I5_9GAMM|nr:IclR family transcriptional regulator [Marinobacterium zhoushanense]GGB87209.1 IclR family transcriptional regulator [Marinobacterium zhoushanense]
MSSDLDTDSTDNPVTPTRQGIGSLELGLKILDTIAQSAHPLSLKELSQRLQLSPSRLYKYLVSLMRTDYIVQDRSNCYSLAHASLTLGVAALRRIDPIQLTFQAVEKLNTSKDVTTSVTIWNGHAPLVIKWLDASQPVAVNVRLGIELSPFFSVSGRIFLANLPRQRMLEIVEAFYQSPPALPRHNGTPIQKEAFYRHLEEVRERNYCCFYGDYLPDINVMGSAIHDINGNVSSVVSIMGLAGDIDVRPGGPYHRALLSCTRQVTDQICGQR